MQTWHLLQHFTKLAVSLCKSHSRNYDNDLLWSKKCNNPSTSLHKGSVGSPRIELWELWRGEETKIHNKNQKGDFVVVKKASQSGMAAVWTQALINRARSLVTQQHTKHYTSFISKLYSDMLNSDLFTAVWTNKKWILNDVFCWCLCLEGFIVTPSWVSSSFTTGRWPWKASITNLSSKAKLQTGSLMRGLYPRRSLVAETGLSGCETARCWGPIRLQMPQKQPMCSLSLLKFVLIRRKDIILYRKGIKLEEDGSWPFRPPVFLTDGSKVCWTKQSSNIKHS